MFPRAFRISIALPFLLATLLLPACSRDEPTKPGPHNVTGSVILTGSLTAKSDGHYKGTRVVGDADGVLVELVYGDQVVQRTTTVDGVYRFSGVWPGGYLVRAPIVDGISFHTRTITVASIDQFVADTLRLDSYGDLYPNPNPMTASIQIYFDVLSDTSTTEVRVVDLSGHLVKTLHSIALPENRRVTAWYGEDENNHQVNGPMYWVTYSVPNDSRAQLVFR